jgi:Fe-S-cluster containining protein
MNFQHHQQAIVERESGASAFQQRVAAVSQAHEEIDRHTTAFADTTGIACPENCGRCCHSPQVETTVADILPLAVELVQTGQADAVIQRLDERIGDPRCVLFAPDAHDESRGRCTMYAWRPSICRLFGFAGRIDPDGKPQFSACRTHTQVMPEIVAAAKQAIAEGRISLPILSDLAGCVRAAAPGGMSRPMPINAALREAIHAAGLHVWLAAIQDNGDDNNNNDNDGNDGKPTPHLPPLAA